MIFWALALVTPVYGFVGYGRTVFRPTCASACRSIFASAELACSTHFHGQGGHGHGQAGPFSTTPQCYADDASFLSTVAYCIEETCPQDLLVWEREKFWNEKITGNPLVLASLSYEQAVAVARNATQDQPAPLLPAGVVLNFTASVDREVWKFTNTSFDVIETNWEGHSTSGIVLLVAFFGLPVLITLLLSLPFMSSLADRIRPYLLSSTVRGYHVRPLPKFLGNPPTIGQSIYIFLFFALNVILSSIYKITFPHPWFTSRAQQLTGLVAARTGVLAFAILPLVILFAGRNNVLLWMTNWSHSTFQILHRWTSRVFALHVIVHSFTELVIRVQRGVYPVELVKEYWIWGAVATVATSAMMIFSVLWFRSVAYELFLVLHILFAAFVLIGSWYHIILVYGQDGIDSYGAWFYAAFAVWAFDRMIRLLRTFKSGNRRARLTNLGTDIVRVDVEGVRWAYSGKGTHSYVYYPTLSRWRIWENHPFSVVPTAIISSHRSSSTIDDEKVSDSSTKSTSSGITFFIRRSKGLTQHISATDSPSFTLPVWLEGPYHDRSIETVLRSDRLVLIAGGIGITGVLPLATSPSHAPNVKLYWSLKAECKALLEELRPTVESRVGESELLLGERFDLEKVLRQEAKDGWNRIGVVVCGPGGMCDDVRKVVVELGKENNGVTFDLAVEAFSW